MLDEIERQCAPLPADATVCVCTPNCTEHSPLKHDRAPWETEAQIEPLFRRLKEAPGVLVVILENVPAFLSTLQGQQRSTYSFWIEGLRAVGFDEHAGAVLRSGASGDLHDRRRLLSIHCRAGCFSPAAALARLLEAEEEPASALQAAPSTLGSAEPAAPSALHSAEAAPSALASAQTQTQPQATAGVDAAPPPLMSGEPEAQPSAALCPRRGAVRHGPGDVPKGWSNALGCWEQQHCTALAAPEAQPDPDRTFAFTIGLSMTRAEHKGGIKPVYGRLPAYNRSLDAAVFHRGRFYQVSPWLAQRASALPDKYQLPLSGALKAQPQPLANMVSPLLARDVGYAIASEWERPRPAHSEPRLQRAQLLSSNTSRQRQRGGVPSSFPQSGGLIFNRLESGTWHVLNRCSWRQKEPPIALEELCDMALKLGELRPLGSGREVELRRVAADGELPEEVQSAARSQLLRVGAPVEATIYNAPVAYVTYAQVKAARLTAAVGTRLRCAREGC